ncbi:helix-turn-helix domain-containing protein [Haladaptatus sp. CMAA 1911]|uniref:helix-turn-helix domain-containing protein n=1 Tax=unclassified Haladaptatus TaxID=2622732 RepID=UPI003753F5D9
MPHARVKFKPPTSVPGGPFNHSVEHPEDDLRILSAYPGENGLVVVLEATTTDPGKIVHLFEDVPVEMFSEVIHRDERTVLLQFQLPFVPSAYRAVFASKNLPQFPYVLEDGWMVCELTTTHERLSRFKDELERSGFTFVVDWIRQSADPEDLLTDRQHRFITRAIEKGYYDTPRRCSLTELAGELDVSKSTLSVVLHRAEETVITEFFAESD